MNYIFCSFPLQVILTCRGEIFWNHDAFSFFYVFTRKLVKRTYFLCNYFPAFRRKYQEKLNPYPLFHGGLIRPFSFFFRPEIKSIFFFCRLTLPTLFYCSIKATINPVNTATTNPFFMVNSSGSISKNFSISFII